MKKVSIIIPAHNESEHILECFESIKKQNYTNIEVILVDDGSKDETFELASAFAKNDKRFVVIRNERRGVSSARNKGILTSTGELIVFVDADDYVSNGFIYSLVSLIVKHSCDCACVSYTSESKKLALDTKAFTTVVCNKNDKFDLLNERITGAKGFVWNKIYKSDIVKSNKIMFDESISVGEDLLFNYMYFECCNSVVYNPAPLYLYMQNRHSTVNQIDNPRWFDLITVHKMILEDHSSSDYFIEYKLALLILEGIYRYRYCKNISYSLEELKRLKKRYCKIRRNYMPMQKAKLLIFLLLPHISMKYKRRALRI